MQEPDDREPTLERQAELCAAYEGNGQAAHLRGPRGLVFAIRTRGELLWLMREHGWSGKVDDQHQNRVLLCAVSFNRANLHGVHLYMARLQDSNFVGADLSGAILIGAHLLDVSFSEANLQGAHLAGAYCPHSNFARANMEGANMRGADLSWTNLSETNLRGADLFGANLCHAHLTGADLHGADLRAAQVDEETEFVDVVTDMATLLPRGVKLHDFGSSR